MLALRLTAKSTLAAAARSGRGRYKAMRSTHSLAQSMPDSLFVYGSLLAPEVLEALLGRVPELTPASLRGFARYSIQARPYPAIVSSEPGPGSAVSGLCISGLSSSEWEVLDEFEGDEYVKTAVDVDVDGESRPAIVYAWARGMAPELHGTWSYEAFRKFELPTYVAACRRFASSITGRRAVHQLIIKDPGS